MDHEEGESNEQAVIAEPARRGRPSRPIDMGLVEACLSRGHTLQEIAPLYNVRVLSCPPPPRPPPGGVGFGRVHSY